LLPLNPTQSADCRSIGLIRTKTVFVLGAGASQPYGLPLGSELFNSTIVNFINNAAIKTELLNTTPFPRDKYGEFVSALRYSGLASVDAFLEKREEFIDIGKSMITVELLRKEDRDILWTDNRNWMKYLFNQIKTDKLEDFARNTVSFITYNYDRTLEEFLHTSLMNSYGGSAEDCAAVLRRMPIIHLHGRLGYLGWQSERNVIPFQVGGPITAQQIDISQSELRIVHEDIADREKDFQAARRILAEADRIYFMGFGYLGRNIERLRFEEVEPAKMKEGTAKDLTVKERGRVVRLFLGGITLHDMDCLQFLRERVDFD
jgi:hypothetical protein